MDRVFVVEAEAAATEVALRQVMTWASMAALREQLLSGLPMTCKNSLIAEREVPVDVAMRLPVGDRDSWLVRLGMNRPVGPFVAGARLLVLDTEFVGSGGAMLWRLGPRPMREVVVRSTGLGLVVDVGPVSRGDE